MVNPDTGKESTRHTTLSETTWGKTAKTYLKSIETQLDDSTMELIINQAISYAKSNIEDGSESLGSIEDECALLVEGDEADHDSDIEYL